MLNHTWLCRNLSVAGLLVTVASTSIVAGQDAENVLFDDEPAAIAGSSEQKAKRFVDIVISNTTSNTSTGFGRPSDAKAETDGAPVILEGLETSVESGAADAQVVAEVGQRIDVRLNKRIVRVEGFNPNVVVIQPVSPQRLRITGKRAGTTTLSITDDNDTVTLLEVTVRSRTLADLSRTLQQLFPGVNIELHELTTSVVLRGEVKEALIPQIVDVALEFYPKVLNQMSGTKAKAYQFAQPAPHNVVIPKGMRVVTIPISGDDLSQLLSVYPGRRVDVSVAYPKEKDVTRVQPLIKAAEVFAFSKSAEGTAGLVSLLVKPEELSGIKLAAKRGSLYVERVSRPDAERESLIDDWLQDLDTHDRQAPDNAAILKEVRSLQQDVKRLIELLEKRQANEPPGQNDDNGTAQTHFPDETDLILFYAEWSGPGRKMRQLVPPIAAEVGAKLHIYDVDQHRQLARSQEVTVVPTLLRVRNGQVVDRITGLTDTKRVRWLIEHDQEEQQ